MFELKDPAVNTHEIAEVVWTRLEHRRELAKQKSIDFEQLAQPVSLRETTRQLTFTLMDYYQTRLRVEPYQVPDKINVVSAVLLRLKKQAHDLAVYYVNTLAKKQRLFNSSVAQAIKMERSEIAHLQQQITLLEEKVEQLQAATSTSKTQHHG